MEDLVPIKLHLINGAEVNSINSRELYYSIGLAKGQYSRWIKANLLPLFKENQDYIRVRQTVEGNDVESFIITLDVAKHLCMLTKTDKAMNYRNYLINIEKEYIKNLQNKTVPTKTPIELAQEAIEALTIQLEKEKKAKERANKMLDSTKLIEVTNEETDEDISVEEFCKMISDKFSILIGRTTVYAILREMGLIMHDSTKPTQRGLLIYLRYRKHEKGYSTRVFIGKADKLSKYMLKFLATNPEINEALGNPFDI
jgi:phage anti-repressor protein